VGSFPGKARPAISQNIYHGKAPLQRELDQGQQL